MGNMKLSYVVCGDERGGELVSALDFRTGGRLEPGICGRVVSFILRS